MVTYISVTAGLAYLATSPDALTWTPRPIPSGDGINWHSVDG
ncbi:hypothetical protein [Streptomyces roseochromogenus]|uniref:Uncharacterized protein n=1 Tax=Streptomyces roseochromogenus subsp. oscitans DS 12.976 TaxID=1352936 RepID=V6K6Z0_STRRC|nr:hypothetical protein [Streptomyces roseochromogenus]EST27813.1 hypothetical protein M878_24130 [Streptomyces roseochromogenus subsp. oscitans DS 12.976]